MHYNSMYVLSNERVTRGCSSGNVTFISEEMKTVGLLFNGTKREVILGSFNLKSCACSHKAISCTLSVTSSGTIRPTPTNFTRLLSTLPTIQGDISIDHSIVSSSSSKCSNDA